MNYNAGWRYMPALDGVRALAVLAVVAFHYWPDVFPGGFLGVDVFFVMSGFLITGILQSEHGRTGGIDLRAFWGRRIRRLVPAVVVLVIVCSLAAWATGTGSTRQLADSVGALTWTTNLIEAFFGGSRIWLANPRTMLDHLWSLAIEEQFYLLWPLLALLLLRRVASPRARVAAVMGGVAASAALMGWIGGIHAYFRTDTRAFELLIGAALALTGVVGGGSRRPTGQTMPRSTAVRSTALALVAVGVLGVYVAFVDPLSDWMFPGGFLLLALSAAVLVAVAADPPPLVAAVLEAGPVRRLGQVSYGVYLWHIPVLRVLSPGRTNLGGLSLNLLRLVVLAALVELSFRFVEEPIRRGRVPFGGKALALGYGLAAVSLLTFIGPVRKDLERQWDPADGPPRVAAGDTRVLVMGDLLGAFIAGTIDEAPDRADDGLAVWSLADAGCPAIEDGDFREGPGPLEVDDYCDHWRERVPRAIDRFDPDVVLIAGGYWDTLELRRDGKVVAGDDLVDTYRGVIESQVEMASVGGRRVVLVQVDDWERLFGADQRNVAERASAAGAYNQALEAVVAAAGSADVDVLEVPGRATWGSVAELATETWPELLTSRAGR